MPIWTQLSARAKGGVLISASVVLTVLLGACLTEVQPIAVKVTEMGTCASWNAEENRPVNETDVFTTEDRRIYMYAYVVTNQKLFFQTLWFYEGTTAWQQVGEHETGYMNAYVEPKEGELFPVGDYEVHLLLGRNVIRNVKFRVVDSDQVNQ